MDAFRLEASGIAKRYGPVRAVDGVSVRFVGGEIHAVLGENGAGKSTLMNVVSGFSRPDEGTVSVDGVPLPLGDPIACKRHGIEMIHQHFMLVPEFTVAENLALARVGRPTSRIEVALLAEQGLRAGDELGWKFDSAARVRTLSVGVQQRLEILKALATDARAMIFDEPTAVLASGEVDDLFRVLRHLKSRGKAIILIAHKLSEVLSVADRVTVLRRGRVVATAVRADIDAEKLTSWMVGELPPKRPINGVDPGDLRLVATDVTVRGDRGETAVRGASLTIRSREIVGIGGVDGNGQVELAEALAGVRPIGSGRIMAGNLDVRSPHASVGYLPQDRQTDGLAMAMSVRDNLLVTGHRRAELVRGPFMLAARISAWAQQLVARYEIQVGSILDPVSSLSGGNQQKVVASRILDSVPDILVAVNPARGLDVRATEFVHGQLLHAKSAGAAIALFSTDLDELVALSDRTVFMSRGEFVSDEGASAIVGGKN